MGQRELRSSCAVIPYNNLVYSLQRPGDRRSCTSFGDIALGDPPVPRQLVDVPEPGHHQPALQHAAPPLRAGASPASCCVGNLSFPVAVQLHLVDAAVPAHETADCGVSRAVDVDRAEATMTLDSKIPDGPIEEKWDNHKFDIKLVNPANKRRFEIVVVGTGLAGASAAATPRRARLPGEGHHLPRLAAARALDRRAGRDQRRQELPERRRQRLPPLLRHDEGRRLPRPRGQRVPPRAGVGRHHRPVRRPGRAVRPRVRRPARQPQLRRRAGVAHVLRAGPDRPAAAARRLPGAHAPGPRRQRDALPARRDARPRRQGRPHRRHRVPRPRDRRRVLAVGARGRARDRRLRQRLLPLDEREELERHRRVARREAWRVLRQPLLHADPPHVHPGERRLPVEAHADVGVVAQRRPDLGAEADGRRPLARPDPRERARLPARAPLPVVRQPRGPRRRLARDQARGRRRAAVSGR